MKKQIKKISIFLLVLFVCACSNTNTSGTGKSQDSVVSNEKESFSNTTVAKLFKKYDFRKIPRREDILKDEYSSIEDLLKNTYPNHWKAVVENNKEKIKEAEKIAKTKFFRVKDRDGFPKDIYFGIDDPKYDFGVMGISDDFISKIKKYSTKEYIEEGTPFVLHQSLRDSLDIKSLGLDPASEKKLLEAQNHKGI
jgi:lipoprotein